MPEDNNINKILIDTIKKNQKKTEIPENEILQEISDSLKEIKNGQKKLVDSDKEQKVQELKKRTEEKTQEPTTPKPAPKKEPEKELGFLRKQFEKSFGGIKEILKPGSILKSAGLFTGSPLFILLGDKLNDILNSYNEHKESSKQSREDALELQKEQQKSSFLNEAIKDKEMSQTDETNEYLKKIADNTEDIIDNTEKEKKSPLEFLKAPLAALKKFLPASIVSAFASIPGFKALTTLGKGSLGKGLLKGMLKGSGVAALFASIPEFFKGSKQAEEILGRKIDTEGMVAEFGNRAQAGLSQALSGLTFGLVDPKIISKGIDQVFQRLIGFFMSPFEAIKDALDGRKPFSEIIFDYFSKLTFGILSPEFIQNSLNMLTEKIKSIFEKPFNILKGLVDQTKQFITDEIDKIMNIGDSILNSINSTFDSIHETISNLIQKITAGIFEKVEFLQEKIDDTVGLVKTPFKKLKSFLFDGDDEVEKETSAITRKYFKINQEIDTVNNRTTDNLKTVQRENVILQKIKDEKVKQQAQEIEKKSTETSTTNNQNNLLNNNIYNNIYPSEDMTTKTDDRSWNLVGAEF